MLGYREVYALVLEALKTNQRSQYRNLAQKVIELARSRNLIGAQAHLEEHRIIDLVREALWQCLVKHIIIFGSDNANESWPFYRLTEYGLSVLDSVNPQPYDPDGFLRHFRAAVPNAHPAVDSYLAEGVRAFNAGCLPAAAVMLGCASEKLLLMLCEQFEASITDATKQTKFASDIASKWQVAHKYQILKSRLDQMVAAKALPHEHAETIAGELPSGFELLRRCRNAAGHPDVPGTVDSDTVFLNLRAFVEYARKMQRLIEHFAMHSARW